MTFKTAPKADRRAFSRIVSSLTVTLAIGITSRPTFNPARSDVLKPTRDMRRESGSFTGYTAGSRCDPLAFTALFLSCITASYASALLSRSRTTDSPCALNADTTTHCGQAAFHHHGASHFGKDWHVRPARPGRGCY
jgi:hypothetical protein